VSILAGIVTRLHEGTMARVVHQNRVSSLRLIDEGALRSEYVVTSALVPSYRNYVKLPALSDADHALQIIFGADQSTERAANEQCASVVRLNRHR
jgi:hypothetical protein